MNYNIRKDWRGYFSPSFYDKLTKGIWKPLMELIAHDPELDVQIRKNYINVYYKGGNLLEIKSKGYKFDPHYFYNEDFDFYSKNIPITFIEKINAGKEIKKKRNNKDIIPDKILADKIIKEIKTREIELLDHFKSGRFKEYIAVAKQAMDSWRKNNKRNERKDQHYISLSNRSFSSSNNIVVVDIEFKLSTNKNQHYYNNTGTSPSFDIIGIDETGQLYVIELKENKSADGENKKANVDNHLADFENSIGEDIKGDFISEITQLVHIKNELGLLSLKGIKVSKNKPIFAISYSGENEDSFYSSHPDILHIKVKNHKLIK